MKTKFLLITIAFLSIFTISCKQEVKDKPKEKEVTEVKPLLKDYMVGNWETSYIKIEYPTYLSSDSTYVFEDNFSKPNTGKAQSTYKNDGTFSAWFLQPNGEKVGESSGKWKTKGDSLYVDYPYLGKNVQAWYLIKQTKVGFEGKVIYDWDNDGTNDDLLVMRSTKLK